MAKRLKFDRSGDSDDLQALFDSISGSCRRERPARVSKWSPVPPPAPVSPVATMTICRRCSIPWRMNTPPNTIRGEPCRRRCPSPQLRQHQPDRRDDPSKLHDTRELGYDRSLQEAARHPDARQRLAYIAEMTEQAASKVLNATDIAKPIQDKVRPTPKPCAPAGIASTPAR